MEVVLQVERKLVWEVNKFNTQTCLTVSKRDSMHMGHSPYIIRDYWEFGSLFFDNHMIIVCFDVSYYLKQSIYIYIYSKDC